MSRAAQMLMGGGGKQQPAGGARCCGGVSADIGRLTYSTWHFEAAATQAVSADLIQLLAL